jgi:hypothetical protein
MGMELVSPLSNMTIGRAIAEAVSQVRFVVDKVASGQVFSEYFGFPCHSFHQILHPHNHPGQVFSEYFGFPCHSFHQILHPYNHPGQVQ